MARARRRQQAVKRRGRRARLQWSGACLLMALALGVQHLSSAFSAASSSGEAAAAPLALESSAAETSLPGAGEALAQLKRGDVIPPDRASQEQRARTLYELAAARYGVSSSLLVALHSVESSAAPGGCIPNLEGSGAVGPFQFMPSTFRAFGVDADGDGLVDICSFPDSLFSAARYLQSLGADADPASATSRRALESYGTDPGRVIVLAR